MDNKQMEMLLIELLDCGYADLSVIGSTEYDWTDIIEHCKGSFGEISLNLLSMSIVDLGISDLSERIGDIIEELELEDSISESEQEKLDELKSLDVAEDIEGFYNYIDTHVNIVNNEEIYLKYLDEALDEFEHNTGFSLK